MSNNQYTFISDEYRFLDKITKTNTCWLWNAHINYKVGGYGAFKFRNRMYGAHVVSYILFKGEVPKGKEVCHIHSGNRHCVNPEHLYIGTHKQNMQDRLRDGNHPMKNKTHCKHGHEFTKENIFYQKGNKNWRGCKTCRKKIALKHYYKKKED